MAARRPQPARGKETMREKIQARLTELRGELEAGEAELARVEQQRTYLRETLLRISGAVQVMEELLAEEHPAERRSAGHADAVLGDAASDPAEARPDGVRAGENERVV